MNENNNANVQIYYLCNDTDSEKDNDCKKLIEMVNVIVLNKLLNNPRYINKNNKIAYTILNDNINRSTNKLNLPEMTKEEREKYENENYAVIVSDLDEYMNNLANNGVDTNGQNMGQDMGENQSHHMDQNQNQSHHMGENQSHYMGQIPNKNLQPTIQGDGSRIEKIKNKMDQRLQSALKQKNIHYKPSDSLHKYMPTHLPHMPKGGNISKRKSYKKQADQKTKNHKKTKTIRKK